jgi:hypothetical protein
VKRLFPRKSVRIEWAFSATSPPGGDHFHFSQQIFILLKEGLRGKFGLAQAHL